MRYVRTFIEVKNILRLQIEILLKVEFELECDWLKAGHMTWFMVCDLVISWRFSDDGCRN